MAAALRFLAYAILTILNIGICHCLAEFEMFPGFDAPLETNTTSTTTKPTTKFFFYKATVDHVDIFKKSSEADNAHVDIFKKSSEADNAHVDIFKKSSEADNAHVDIFKKSSEADNAHVDIFKKSNEADNAHVDISNKTNEVDNVLFYNGTSINNQLLQLNSTQVLSNTSSSCPEEERPTNIGPYEVPTQQDLVIQMKAKLLKMFNKYHRKALNFLKDIKEASIATSEIAFKCPSTQRHLYKKCVKHVKNQCKMITKNLVTSLEYQRHDVMALTEDTICNMTGMQTDPVELIKRVAMEEASLDFALPGFLRLLSACSYYCDQSQNSTKSRLKPQRHLSDQELVVRHLLMQKNYVLLVKSTP